MDKDKVQETSKYTTKILSDCKYPLMLESTLEYLWEKATIDIAGWNAFRRLVLLED